MRSRRTLPYLTGALLAFILGLAVLGPGSSTPAAAETVSVAIRDFAFSPATISIPVGTTVTWTNEDQDPHTATSTSGVWNSGILNTGGAFGFTFDTPGSFPYLCALHPSMRGTVVVTAAPTPTPRPPTPTSTPAPPPVVSAPTLTGPDDGATLTSFGPSLTWTTPPGTTQYHLQVIPAENDGPGVDLHVGSSDTSFQIPPPPEWYGLLPDMTYTWRVRVSDAVPFVELDDPSWSPWTERKFRTPTVTSATISVVAPANGTSVTTLTPTLQWANSRSDVFYYEVQLSKDQTFNTDPATATAMIHSALRHVGATTPPNSYIVPAGFPLEPGLVYFWRVRPRVQGDGQPVPWSQNFSFTTTASTPFAIVGTVDFTLDSALAITAAQLNMASVIGPTVIRLKDGNYRLYVQSRDRSNNVNIISATSTDGAQWTPDPGIRIQHGSAEQPDWEAGEPDVYNGPEGKYYMAYTGRQSVGPNTLLHKIIFATSDDGLTWTKLNTVYADPQNPDGFASSADVISTGGGYVVYYTGGRAIVRAVSTDGISWTRQGVTIKAGHDSSTVRVDGIYYMFAKIPATLEYPARGPINTEEDALLMAISADGINWSSNLYRVVVKRSDGAEVANPELQDPAAIVLADGSLRVYLNNDRGLGIVSIRPAQGLPRP